MAIVTVLQKSRVIYIFLGFIALCVRLLIFINHYAVNLMFWDQWYFMIPIFKNSSFWSLFTQQNGPIRLGIGLVLTKYWMMLSQWNTRVDSFIIGITICIAALGALALKKRLFGTWSITDIVILLAMLTLGQYETFVGTPNISHSALPVLFAVLISFAWSIKKNLVKTILIVSLNFLAVFTGFGLFLGLINLFLFIVDIYRHSQKKSTKDITISSLGLAGSIITFILFFSSYAFDPAVSCFRLSPGYIARYPLFMGIMEAKFFQIDFQVNKIGAMVFGVIIVMVISVACLHSLVKLFQKKDEKERQKNIATFILLSFPLLFCLDTAAGRICLGMASAESSRYMTIVSLGLVGLYFYLSGYNFKSAKIFTFVLAGLLCLTLLPMGTNDVKVYEGFYFTGKTAWKSCYLKDENLQRCSQVTNFLVYPDVNDAWVKQALAYLKENHLNLYVDSRP